MSLALALSLFAGAGAGAQTLSPPAPRPDGVTPAVEQAIRKGFQYLLKNQLPNGSWGASPQRPDIYPVAVTGLVGLAFLAHGDTVTRGEYAPIVEKIADFLLESQTEDTDEKGLFTSGQEHEPRARKGARPMYGHAFAMTFLSQLLGQEGGLERRERIRNALRAAVELTARTQTNDGGWGYAPNYWEDEGTLTVTQLQALRSARDAGIFVPKSVIDGGVKFIEHSSREDGAVRYRVQDQEVRPGVTCAAVVALWNAGQYDSPMLKKTRDYVNRTFRTFQWEGGYEHAEYIAYYLAQAKWIMGGDEWKRFYEMASQRLVQLQQSDGNWYGSDASKYGQTFATAIALIILQLPYDRLLVYQR